MARRTTPALRLHQSLAQQLGTAILAGRYAPGDILDGEIEQSAALKVSRTAYREAMRILVAKGLLESRPRIGTKVTPRERWNLLDPDMLAWAFSDKPDERFVRDLFELRGILEPAAAALAAQRRSDAQAAAMREALAGMHRHGLATDEGQAADRLFHHLILLAAGNAALLSLSGSVEAAVGWTTRFKQRAQRLPRDPLPDHSRVFEAIEAGDPEAARAAMHDLLRLALADMEICL